jgi:hypothetical protein
MKKKVTPRSHAKGKRKAARSTPRRKEQTAPTPAELAALARITSGPQRAADHELEDQPTHILLYHNIPSPRGRNELNPDKRPGAAKYILRVPISDTGEPKE